MDTQTLISNFLELQKGYQFTRRALMTKERFLDVAHADKDAAFDISRDDLKEPLIEHVGHLPVLATYLYEHSEQRKKVNLGRVLIMLAVHDIGETKLGDIFAYSKTNDEEKEEEQMALSLLSPYLRPYYEEYELGESYDAKYAKAIDILAPIIHEVDMIGIIARRFDLLGGTLAMIITKKRKYLEWDSVLLDVFDVCLENSRRCAAGEDLLFPTVEYDIKYESTQI